MLKINNRIHNINVLCELKIMESGELIVLDLISLGTIPRYPTSHLQANITEVLSLNKLVSIE